MTQLLEAPRKKKVVPFRQRKNYWLSIGKNGFWIFFWLVLVDIGINVLFPLPQDIDRSPGMLAQYFDYGRSIEGKLNRMVGQDVESSALIVDSGWIDPNSWKDLPTRPQAGPQAGPQADDNLLLVNYGMSFSDYASQAVAEIDGKITVRSIGGPSAPPNHSFAAFKADAAGRKNADVVVIGVLASSVQRMSSMSGTDWTYEFPNPYTYPYYSVDESGELVAVEPAISTAKDFVESFNRKDGDWQRLQGQLAQYDNVFDPFVFYTNWTDRSAIVRLIRRGWAERARSLSEQDLFDPQTGFNPEASEIITLKALLAEFVSEVRAADQVPVILLLNDRGYGTSLYDVLSEQVESLDALVVSTHAIAPADDPKNFIADGHFTDEANHRIAEEIQRLIRSEKLAAR